MKQRLAKTKTILDALSSLSAHHFAIPAICCLIIETSSISVDKHLMRPFKRPGCRSASHRSSCCFTISFFCCRRQRRSLDLQLGCGVTFSNCTRLLTSCPGHPWWCIRSTSDDLFVVRSNFVPLLSLICEMTDQIFSRILLKLVLFAHLP